MRAWPISTTPSSFEPVGLLLGCVITLSACCPDDRREVAISAIDAAYRVEFERIINEDGTKIFKVSRREAFESMKRALAAEGYLVENEDLAAGVLTMAGPAPAPLSQEEWQRLAQLDLPLFKELISDSCGFWAGQLADFQLDGVELVVYVTAVENGPYMELTASMRMRSERLLDPQGLPRRSYPPPHAFQGGMVKLWRLFQRELGRQAAVGGRREA